MWTIIWNSNAGLVYVSKCNIYGSIEGLCKSHGCKNNSITDTYSPRIIIPISSIVWKMSCHFIFVKLICRFKQQCPDPIHIHNLETLRERHVLELIVLIALYLHQDLIHIFYCWHILIGQVFYMDTISTILSYLKRKRKLDKLLHKLTAIATAEQVSSLKVYLKVTLRWFQQVFNPLIVHLK